jgi:hypothetical protein
MITLKEMHAQACAFGEEQMRKKNGLASFFYTLLDDGRTVVIPTPWNNQEEKEDYVAAIRVLANEGLIKAYSFVSEAWLATVDPKTQKELMNVRPSDRSDREDVLMVISRNREGEVYSTKYHVDYDATGTATLGLPEHMDGFTDQGLIANLFDNKPRFEYDG